MSLLGIPSNEIKKTLANTDRALAEVERAAQHLQALLITANAILDGRCRQNCGRSCWRESRQMAGFEPAVAPPLCRYVNDLTSSQPCAAGYRARLMVWLARVPITPHLPLKG